MTVCSKQYPSSISNVIAVATPLNRIGRGQTFSGESNRVILWFSVDMMVLSVPVGVDTLWDRFQRWIVSGDWVMVGITRSWGVPYSVLPSFLLE